MTSARTAHALGPDDLVWDHFSRPLHDDVVGRIHAAANAGFAAIGLFVGTWAAVRRDEVEVDRITAALDETGLFIANIETLWGWIDPDDSYWKLERLAFEMADVFDCRHLQVIGDEAGSLTRAPEAFGALCDRAGEHGLLVGLEWVPSMTNIETATTAAQIITEADRTNGGLCFDAWHMTRSTNDLDELRRLPGEKIFTTQWNDGTTRPQHDDYYEDCLANRVPPGEGEFPLVEMVRILDETGCTAPIGLEVCSAELWAAPVEQAARASADAMRAVLIQARK